MWFVFAGVYELLHVKEHPTIVSILYTLKYVIWIFNLLGVRGVEVTTVTTTNSQEPSCWLLNKVYVNILVAL